MIAGQKLTTESSTKKLPLGTRFFDENTGKTWYYVKANEALAKGAILTALVAEIDGACDASSGKNFVDVAATLTSGMVDSYIKINANTASIDQKPNRIAQFVDASNLIMEDEWETALTTSEEYLIYNPWKVEECDAAAEKICGVAQMAITSGYYFWMQTGGLCDFVKVEVSSGIVANRPIVSSTTAGAGTGVTAPAASDTWTTANGLVRDKEQENPAIMALIPTAIAQLVPAILNCPYA